MPSSSAAAASTRTRGSQVADDAGERGAAVRPPLVGLQRERRDDSAEAARSGVSRGSTPMTV
jgi:hypothetical protein